MRGSYLNDPCRELRTGEPDDKSQATEPSLAAQDRAEDLLCEFVADHPPTAHVIALARELERFAAEYMDAAKVYAAPPWLSVRGNAGGRHPRSTEVMTISATVEDRILAWCRKQPGIVGMRYMPHGVHGYPDIPDAEVCVVLHLDRSEVMPKEVSKALGLPSWETRSKVYAWGHSWDEVATKLGLGV